MRDDALQLWWAPIAMSNLVVPSEAGAKRNNFVANVIYTGHSANVALAAVC
jgi:hypothetical protein